jgi:hypothetical protein
MAVVARTINALWAKTEKNGVTQRCPASRASALAAREGREEEGFRYQDIEAVAESFLHGGS